MSERVKKRLCGAAFLAGLALGGGALWAGGAVPEGGNGLLCGLGGAALGVGGSGLATGWIVGRLSPEDQAAVAVAEHDERNVAIRQRAAQSSWFWTGWLLWVPFVAALVTGNGLFTALTAGVIVLHNAFLLVNIALWSRRM
mgnify:CR=1 FL=1